MTSNNIAPIISPSDIPIIPATKAKPILPGDFSFVRSTHDRMYLVDAYKTISKIDGGWEFFKNETPPENKGYMFWGHEMINKVANNLEFVHEHSGCSMGWLLRQMEIIAKEGWKKYVESYLSQMEEVNGF